MFTEGDILLLETDGEVCILSAYFVGLRERFEALKTQIGCHRMKHLIRVQLFALSTGIDAQENQQHIRYWLNEDRNVVKKYFMCFSK